MKNKFCMGFPSTAIILCIAFLAGCQSAPPAATNNDIDSDVCIGEVVVADPDKPLDLEEMAKQIDCE